MNRQDITRWADRAYTMANDGYGLRPSCFWPVNGHFGQGSWTTWAWAFFLSAVDEAVHEYDPGRELDFSASPGRAVHDAARSSILRALWTNRKYTPHETVVDLSVVDWDAEHPMLATCESEMAATWGVGDSLDGQDDYSWDFFKLLLVPSKLRLFVCRVGELGDQTGRQRRDTLEVSLRSVFDAYPHLTMGAEVGVVILSEEWRHDEWKDARYMILRNGGAFESGKVWA